MKKFLDSELFSGISLGLSIGVILTFLAFKFDGTKERYHNIDNTCISMPDYYREITGFDSIQLIYGGRGKYNEKKQRYDVTWDSLYANFCYPNKWEFEKFKKDTVLIHDTLTIINR